MSCNNILLFGFVVGALQLNTAYSACTSTGNGCITASAASCLNLPDGDYQACEDCTVYHSCSGGVNWANRPCPYTNYLGLRGKLVWKQITRGSGFCDYTSNTCTECVNSGSGGTGGGSGGSGGSSGSCTSTGSGCITASAGSCLSRPDGDYQACEGCTFYHSCSGGVNWANRPCPATNTGGLHGKLVWRKTGTNSGYCDYSSTTCTECVSGGSSVTDKPPNSGCTSTGSRCISATTSCSGLADGDYQACEGCTFYHSCAAGVNWSNRPCPVTNQGGINGKLVWQSTRVNSGFCDYSSSTCTDCQSGPPTSCSTNRFSKVKCITNSATSCSSLQNGDYQACEGCHIFHTCSNNMIQANRPCPMSSNGGQLVWVTESDGRGHCDFTSGTCADCP